MSIDAHPLIAALVGLEPELVVPWGYILIGSISVMVVSIGASIWPAMTVGRAQPLTLLQAGRASA